MLTVGSRGLLSVRTCRLGATRLMATSTPSGAPKPKIEVETYSDLACPWCYVGNSRISKAIAKLRAGDKADVDVTWHAFLLDPTFQNNHPSGEPLDEYLIAKFGPNALSMKQRVIDSGKSDGAVFHDWKYRANTFPGHRLVALARQHGKSHEANCLLFQESYEKGANISSSDVLIKVGKELDLPGVEEWINSDEGSLEVLKDASDARQMGISGVPAFLIRSGKSRTYMLSGAQPVEVFVEAFEKVLEEGGH